MSAGRILVVDDEPTVREVVAHYLARMSRYTTLYPGDVVWLGCDGPTVPALQEGDLVEVENATMGVLSNRVVREKTA